MMSEIKLNSYPPVNFPVEVRSRLLFRDYLGGHLLPHVAWISGLWIRRPEGVTYLPHNCNEKCVSSCETNQICCGTFKIRCCWPPSITWRDLHTIIAPAAYWYANLNPVTICSERIPPTKSHKRDTEEEEPNRYKKRMNRESGLLIHSGRSVGRPGKCGSIFDQPTNHTGWFFIPSSPSKNRRNLNEDHAEGGRILIRGLLLLSTNKNIEYVGHQLNWVT